MTKGWIQLSLERGEREKRVDKDYWRILLYEEPELFRSQTILCLFVRRPPALRRDAQHECWLDLVVNLNSLMRRDRCYDVKFVEKVGMSSIFKSNELTGLYLNSDAYKRQVYMRDRDEVCAFFRGCSESE